MGASRPTPIHPVAQSALLLLLAAAGAACRRSDPGAEPSAPGPTATAAAPGAAADGDPEDGGSAPPAAEGLALDAPVEASDGEQAPFVPRRLTADGCCARPFWRADSRALWFIDRPEGGETGFYEAALETPLAEPRLITTTIANYSPDQRFRIDGVAGQTELLRLEDGARIPLAAGGRALAFSPGGSRVAWQVGGGPDNAGGGPPADTSNRIFSSRTDGQDLREHLRVANGGLVAWLGEDRLLLRRREGRDSTEDELWVLPLTDGSAPSEAQLPGRPILRAERLRGLSLSRDQSWLAYTVTGSDQRDANGLWIAPTTEGGPAPRRISPFGAFRWRDGRRLLVVPLEPGAASHRLLEVDAATGEQRELSIRTMPGDPADGSAGPAFRIADGDWSVSPDGRQLAWVAAEGWGIWVMGLGR